MTMRASLRGLFAMLAGVLAVACGAGARSPEAPIARPPEPKVAIIEDILQTPSKKFATFCPSDKAATRAHVVLVTDGMNKENALFMARNIAARGASVVLVPYSHEEREGGYLPMLDYHTTGTEEPKTCPDWSREIVAVGIGRGAMDIIEARIAAMCSSPSFFAPRIVLVDPVLTEGHAFPKASCEHGAIAHTLFVAWHGKDLDLVNELRSGEFDKSETELYTTRSPVSFTDVIDEVDPFIFGEDARFQRFAEARGTYDHRAASPFTYPGFNASLVLGTGGRSGDWAFAFGFRPELTLPRPKDGIGYGPYLEIGGARGFYSGVGAHMFVPISGSLVVGPSVGASVWDVADSMRFAPAGGLFFGQKMQNTITYFEGAFGLRVDARVPVGAPELWSLAVQAQLDLSFPVALGAYASSL